MAGEEAGQGLGHGLGAGPAKDGQDRLGDAGGVGLAEGPPLDGRQLLAEEGIGVGHRPLQRAREGVLHDLAVARAGHPRIHRSIAPAGSPAR